MDPLQRAEMRATPAVSEWTYNWDHAECGTAEPTPRDGWADLWMVSHLGERAPTAERELTDLAKVCGLPFKAKNAQLKVVSVDEDPNHPFELKGWLQTRMNKRSAWVDLIEFTALQTVDNRHQADGMYGGYIHMRSKTAAGLGFLQKAQEFLSKSCKQLVGVNGWALVPHLEESAHRRARGRWKVEIRTSDSPHLKIHTSNLEFQRHFLLSDRCRKSNIET